jgi:hypothetical protein
VVPAGPGASRRVDRHRVPSGLRRVALRDAVHQPGDAGSRRTATARCLPRDGHPGGKPLGFVAVPSRLRERPPALAREESMAAEGAEAIRTSLAECGFGHLGPG